MARKLICPGCGAHVATREDDGSLTWHVDTSSHDIRPIDNVRCFVKP